MATSNIILGEISPDQPKKPHSLVPGSQTKQNKYYIKVQDEHLSFQPNAPTDGKLLGALYVSPGKVVLEPYTETVFHFPATLASRTRTKAIFQAVQIVRINGQLPCPTLNEGDLLRFGASAMLTVDSVPIVEEEERLNLSSLTGQVQEEDDATVRRDLPVANMNSRIYVNHNDEDELPRLGSTEPDWTPRGQDTPDGEAAPSREQRTIEHGMVNIPSPKNAAESREDVHGHNPIDQVLEPPMTVGPTPLVPAESEDEDETDTEGGGQPSPVPSSPVDFTPNAPVKEVFIEGGELEKDVTKTMTSIMANPPLQTSSQASGSFTGTALKFLDTTEDQEENGSGQTIDREADKTPDTANHDQQTRDPQSDLSKLTKRGKRKSLFDDDIPGPPKRLKTPPTTKDGTQVKGLSGTQTSSDTSTSKKRERGRTSKTPHDTPSNRSSALRMTTGEPYEGENPRVLFSNATVDAKPEFMKFLKSQGGKKVDSAKPNDFDVLVIGNGPVSKTSKLLFASIFGKPIVTEEWITESEKVRRLLSTGPFKHSDNDLTTGDGSDRSKLFAEKTVYITPALKKDYGSAYKSIEQMLSLCGNTKVLSKPARDVVNDKDTIVFASPDFDPDCRALVDRNIDCFSKELLSVSIMRGRLDTESDEFKILLGGSQTTKRKGSARKSI